MVSIRRILVNDAICLCSHENSPPANWIRSAICVASRKLFSTCSQTVFRSLSSMLGGWLMPSRASDVKLAAVVGRSCRSATAFGVENAFSFCIRRRHPYGWRVQSTTIHAKRGGYRAERSCKPSVGGSAAQQLACWRTCLRARRARRSPVPRVDVRVSEIVTASVRDRGTPYQFGGYLVGTCAVMYPFRMARCHQNALVVLSRQTLL
jgi:hypothetical protein